MRSEFSILAAGVATTLAVGHYLFRRRRILKAVGLTDQQRDERLVGAAGGLFYAAVLLIWMWLIVLTPF